MKAGSDATLPADRSGNCQQSENCYYSPKLHQKYAKCSL